MKVLCLSVSLKLLYRLLANCFETLSGWTFERGTLGLVPPALGLVLLGPAPSGVEAGVQLVLGGAQEVELRSLHLQSYGSCEGVTNQCQKHRLKDCGFATHPAPLCLASRSWYLWSSNRFRKSQWGFKYIKQLII